ncbi:MAG: hypothetical protein ACK5Q5_02600, partial [Planctomycetaceae bacterium]
PLEVASDQTPLVGGAAPVVAAAATPLAAVPANQPMPANSPATDPAAALAAGGSQVDWAAIAPMDVITDEITGLRNDLTAKLNTLATYNQNWENIGVDATELAALAGVVERHPGDVSWKANAKIARTLAAEISSNAAKTGRTAYDATKAPFDNLVDLMNGNAPGDVQADDQAPFGDFADRGVLMAKLESNLNFAKSNITTQQRLEENPDEIKRRMTVLATLMTIVSTDSYDSTSEADYKGFVKQFVSSALQGREAVDAKNLEAFTTAVNDMQKTCNECHLKYAFGGSSF